MSQDRDFTIGQLSQRTGVNIETIRYYERVDVMPAPPRTEGGHRLYDQDHLRRLTFVRRSRELGFSLDEVRHLLGLVDGDNYTCGEVKGLTIQHRKIVREKIADLRKLDKTLAEISAGCDGGSVPECPIIDTLFNESAFFSD